MGKFSKVPQPMTCFFILAITWMSSSGMVNAQDTLITGEVPPAHKIMIINESGQDQTIMIGKDASLLSPVVIPDKEKWLSPVYDYHPLVRIFTDEIFQEYHLIPGKKYRLYWDQRKRAHDIRIVRNKN